MPIHCNKCNYVTYNTVQRLKIIQQPSCLLHCRILLINRNASVANVLNVLVTSQHTLTIITHWPDDISIKLIAVNSVEWIRQYFVNHRVSVGRSFFKLITSKLTQQWTLCRVVLTATRWTVGARYLLDKRERVSPTNNTHWLERLSRSTGCQSPVTQSYISRPAVEARGISVMRPTSTIQWTLIIIAYDSQARTVIGTRHHIEISRIVQVMKYLQETSRVFIVHGIRRFVAH